MLENNSEKIVYTKVGKYSQFVSISPHCLPNTEVVVAAKALPRNGCWPGEEVQKEGGLRYKVLPASALKLPDCSQWFNKS